MAPGGKPKGSRAAANLPQSFQTAVAELKAEDWLPEPLFPPLQPVLAAPLSSAEKCIVAYYLRFRSQIHSGPLYGTLSATNGISNSASTSRISKVPKRIPPAALYDPFEGMPTYSSKYKPQTRTLSRLPGTPQLSFFPKELWATVDPAHHGSESKKRRAKVAQAHGVHETDAAEHGRKGRLDDAGLDDDDDKDDEDAEESGEDQEVDDDFEDDESDMGGDYNAENYFDDGGDDGDEKQYDDGEGWY